ncbi:Heterogeneous nuclear ribonucleoprotein 1 [Glycine soja]
MDSDQGKLFIGGISWDTTEDKLKEHFGNYGNALSTSIMREKNTGKPRGFGFVVFADPNILDRVLEDKHVIDGRTYFNKVRPLEAERFKALRIQWAQYYLKVRNKT